MLSRSGTEAGELNVALGSTFGKNNMASSNVNDGTKTEKSDCEEDQMLVASGSQMTLQKR